MALQDNAGRGILFLFRSAHEVEDFEVSANPVRITKWDAAKLGPQPTDDTINDALNDVTVVNGQTFSQWRAEHGGDLTLTAKRLGKEMIDGSTPEGLLQRAVLQALINAIQAGNLKEGTSVTRQQVINAIKDAIDAE